MPSLSLTPHLPRPCTQLWDWQMHALCRNTGTELFFAHDDEGRGARIRRERQAKAVCATCPVQRECHTHAITVGEPYGVWGGTTEADRRWHEPGPPPHGHPRTRNGQRRVMRISSKHPVPGHNSDRLPRKT
ncbi:WhiB family transcriptional regulator [Rhodococcus opacus]|uniref:WhiB family transcriptional regulator n=2 Tax=Rhodococcus opacus TaxID=37919 RepID=UPI0005669432|nr:WhiB family transcriptional regulator [Rhodococcus opacus]UDG98909.1 WhiB family transcriptional regulator [Rhodococcus opacus PD630]